MAHSRRHFLKAVGSVSMFPSLLALGPRSGQGSPFATKGFKPLPYSDADELSLANGFKWYSVAKRGDAINAKGERFGDCCDYTRFVLGKNPSSAFLWSNHEYVIDAVLYGRAIKPNEKTKSDVEAEMQMVGGSYLELRRDEKSKSQWTLVSDSRHAFRLHALSEIPLVGPAGGRTVLGTSGNCGGGFTPWGTILSGEENLEDEYHDNGGYGWGRFYPRIEEDHGWVVEIDPKTKSARKLTSLGRICHEGATVVVAKNKKVVVYMGEDSKGQCLYKFVSKGHVTGDDAKDKDLLLEGNLYVADFKNVKWQLLSLDNPAIAKSQTPKFKSQADICTNMRAAAHLAGGTKLNRPEDIKIHTKNGDIFFSLTNNTDAGDMHGSIVRLRERGGDHSGVDFIYETFLTGGIKSGLSCPDNLVYGPDDSLWVCSDVSSDWMGKGAHRDFPRNSLWRLEVDKQENVYARHFLQAPKDAEFTGPSFTPDGKTLFISVQHPGETSFLKSSGFSSHWPLGGKATPLSTLVAVEESGASFKQMT